MSHAEKSLIGSVILDPDCIDLVREHVPEGKYFHCITFAEAFDKAVKLKEEGKDVDITTVLDTMNSRNNGAMDKLMEAVDDTPTTAHAEQYAEMVKEAYMRKLLAQALKAINPLDKTKYPTMIDALNELERQQEGLSAMINKGKQSDIRSLLNNSYEKYMEEAENKENTNIIKTGFYDLDKAVSGIEKGETAIIAARPAMGKTALALCMALNIAKQGKGVIIFSLEMTKERLTNRLICIESRINATRYKQRRLHKEEITRMINAISAISDLPIYIYDDVRNTTEIRSLVAKHCIKLEIGGVFVDFLTLLNDSRPSNISQSNYVGMLIQSLQNTGKHYRVPMIVLSQLSRALAQRNNKRPIMTDLRESGNIEEAADTILFLHRQDYYEQEESSGIAELSIAKARDGERGLCELKWTSESTRFDNLAKGVD